VGSTEGEAGTEPVADDWEPGVPSVKELLPSIIGGAIVPLIVYNLVRRHVHSDADALIIAGCFPTAWILFEFIRKRSVDMIGVIVLFGFAVGVITSTLLGGNAYVLKARDSAFTALFGLACLFSLVVADRPLIFYVGRFLSAGNDPVRIAAFDGLHDLPTGKRTFRILTAVWGIGLLVEASTRLVLAAFLGTGIFLAVSPVITGVCIGLMFIFTVWYAKRARVIGQALADEAADVPPIPLT
jgi:hypothetical protein